MTDIFTLHFTLHFLNAFPTLGGLWFEHAFSNGFDPGLKLNQWNGNPLCDQVRQCSHPTLYKVYQ